MVSFCRVKSHTVSVCEWDSGGGVGVSGRTIDRDNDFPGSCPIPVFTQPDPLPLTQVQPSVRDRDREGGSHETGFDMSRHVIRSFARVPERNALSGQQNRVKQ